MVNRLVIVYSLYDYIFKNRAKPPELKLDPDHASLNRPQCAANSQLYKIKPAFALFFRRRHSFFNMF